LKEAYVVNVLVVLAKFELVITQTRKLRMNVEEPPAVESPRPRTSLFITGVFTE
jgi:hypothetical protein